MVPVEILVQPKSVFSMAEGVGSPFTMLTPLPLMLISGLEQDKASPDMVQPLPPLPAGNTKFALSAAEAQ